jgi:1,2-diacylglycerol 3-alpha-glucosyltransferase
VNIVMMTNTYLPHVGGVARSVASFTEAYRRLRHRVLVVAPEYETTPEGETDVYRLPAIANFNNTGFSLRLPIPIPPAVFEEFKPDVVHSHHPFLLGDSALRVAVLHKVPLVFTHHTMYEQYTHYLPASNETVEKFVTHLPTAYANLCDHVIAPSDSLAAILRERGVTSPMTTIPTGIDPSLFAGGDGAAGRKAHGIPDDAFVVGHVGRLAPEKNLAFLGRAVGAFLRSHPTARFLVVGDGPADADLRAAAEEAGAADRLHMPGPLQGQQLADAYQTMNVFAFASRSETQGMVLAEAMTAGVPVVALDAPGARDVVVDGECGRLLAGEDEGEFAAALAELAEKPERRRAMIDGARRLAEPYSLERCAARALKLYEDLIGRDPRHRDEDDGPWGALLRVLEAEGEVWGTRFEAAFRAVSDLR